MPDAPSSTARKLGLAAALLVVAVLLSRVLGLVREQVISGLFGATGATDAFYAAFTIPDILNYVVAGAMLSITFIPIYTRHLSAGTVEEGNRVFSIIVTAMALLVVAAIVGLELATPAIATRYLEKMEPANIDLAIHLTRVLLPVQLFLIIGGLAAATLYARQRFVAASIAPLIYNLGTILGGALLGRRLGIASLAWGTLAGAFAGQFLVQVVAAKRAGLRYRPSLQVTHPEFREWLLATLPLMLGIGLVTADEWIIRYFAAADVGAISCLNYARKLVMVPIAVAGQAVGQASMPFFARLYADGKRDELAQLVTSSARAVAAIAAVAACGLMAIAVPTVDLLFRHGQFATAQVVPTAHFVMLFAVAIPLWGMQGIVARAFYATRDTLTPMLGGTLVTVVSLPIYWLGFQLGRSVGLVLASDVGILLHTTVLLLLLPRRLGGVGRREMVIAVVRAFALGAFAGVPAWFVATYLPHGKLGGHWLSLVQMATGGLVFCALAAPLARPLNVPDVATFFEKLVGRLLRRR
jgi:putative peptidoglycan lipid II flippase